MASIPQTHCGSETGGNYEFAWRGDFLEVQLLSDVGKKRSQNQDFCGLCAPEDEHLARERGILCAVADGMGGVLGGEYASQLALNTIVERYYKSAEPRIPERIRQAVAAANHRIFEAAETNPEYHGMGTTVSAVVVDGDHAYIAQVGDSRVYLARGGHQVSQLTQDHSLVAEQVRSGLISEEEAKNHSLKNLITRAVGTRENINVDLFGLAMHVGDCLLICSDGLSNVVSDEEIAEAMARTKLQAVARLLVGRALEAGAPDNVTVALLRFISSPHKTQLQEGASKIPISGEGVLGKIKRMFS